MFLPQKVLHLEDELRKKKPNISGNYIVSEKLDGWYVYAEYDPNNGWDYFRSSSGRIIPSMKAFKDLLKNQIAVLPQYKAIYIAEAIIPNMDFHIMNGIFNRTKGNCEAFNVQFYFHDVYFPDRPGLTNLQRYNILETHIPQTSDNFKLHKYIDIMPFSAWEDAFKDIISNNKEGIVIKQAEGFYWEGKRNASLMKMKEQISRDLLIVGVEEGLGKYTGMVGNLVCKNKSGGIINVAGLTDNQRIQWWNNPQEIVGRVVEVKAMKELPNGVLREPRFYRVRSDKTLKDID